eukprot:2682151-Rhodomonas_salina.1
MPRTERTNAVSKKKAVSSSALKSPSASRSAPLHALRTHFAYGGSEMLWDGVRRPKSRSRSKCRDGEESTSPRSNYSRLEVRALPALSCVGHTDVGQRQRFLESEINFLESENYELRQELGDVRHENRVCLAKMMLPQIKRLLSFQTGGKRVVLSVRSLCRGLLAFSLRLSARSTLSLSLDLSIYPPRPACVPLSLSLPPSFPSLPPSDLSLSLAMADPT